MVVDTTETKATKVVARRARVDELVIDINNTREHNEANMIAIKESLIRFGQVEPLVVRAGVNVVIGGNGRLAAMRELGWEECDITEVEVTDEEAVALGLALNRTGELAGWNEGKLMEALEKIQGTDIFTVSGFSDEDMNELVARMEARMKGKNEDPGAGEVRAEAVSRRGDIWIMGKHRLMCGDSTEGGDVALLMNGERAGLMATDPPYGIKYENESRPNTAKSAATERIANDDLKDELLQSFLERAFGAAKDCALSSNAAWYLWHAYLTQGYFAAAAAAAADLLIHRQIIWVKPKMLLTRGQYHWKHEPCFMGWIRGNEPPDYGLGNGERTQTTVWEVDSVDRKERKEWNHSTPKPTELFEIPIVKHLKNGEICYEPFAGTGPQVIAAEKLGRRCYAMEIMPQFVDVIIRRWEKMTGAKVILNGTGKTFKQMAKERGVDAAN